MNYFIFSFARLPEKFHSQYRFFVLWQTTRVNKCRLLVTNVQHEMILCTLPRLFFSSSAVPQIGKFFLHAFFFLLTYHIHTPLDVFKQMRCKIKRLEITGEMLRFDCFYRFVSICARLFLWKKNMNFHIYALIDCCSLPLFQCYFLQHRRSNENYYAYKVNFNLFPCAFEFILSNKNLLAWLNVWSFNHFYLTMLLFSLFTIFSIQ